jgi:hypothetical protein
MAIHVLKFYIHKLTLLTVQGILKSLLLSECEERTFSVFEFMNFRENVRGQSWEGRKICTVSVWWIQNTAPWFYAMAVSGMLLT